MPKGFEEFQIQDAKDAQTLLERKRKERDALDAEIRGLEHLTAPTQILVSVKMVEISRTKLRTLGIDWARSDATRAKSEASASKVESVQQLLEVGRASGSLNESGDSFSFHVADSNDAFFGILAALQKNNVAKILADPKLVVTSGRPASLHVGGEFPVPGPNGGAPVEFKEYGTRVDCLATQLGGDRIRLEARPRVTEIIEGKTIDVGGRKIPAMSVLQIDTAAELKSGQTLVLAGLIQKRAVQVPVSQATGAAKQPSTEEIELVVMMKCELVGAPQLSNRNQSSENVDLRSR